MSESMQPTGKPDRGYFARGFIAVIAIATVHLCLGIMLAMSSGIEGLIFFGSLRYIGLTQLIYVVPLVVRARHLRQSEEIKGITVASALVFIINAACWEFS